MKFKKTAGVIIIFCVLLFSALFLKDYHPVQHIRSQYPNMYAIIRNVIWEMDEEIGNVGSHLNIPLMELKLSKTDLAHFDDLYRKFEDPSYDNSYYTANNNWKKAKLRFDGELYNIKIRSMGSDPTSHRKDQFISYTIKLLNKKNINNLSRFNLIIHERIRPNRHLNIYMAEKFNVIHQGENLIRLKINGWEEKLYFMEERVRSDLMETHYNSSLKILRSRNQNGIVNDRTLIMNSNKDFSKVSDNDSLRIKFERIFDDENIKAENRAPIYERYLNLNNFLQNPDIEPATEFFNLEYISSFEAVRMVLGFIGHGGNDYLVQNWADGKFYPVIHRDNVPIFLHDSDVLESQLYRIGNEPFPLFVALNRSDEIRQHKYKKIYKLLTSDLELVSNDLMSLYEKYERLHYRGWLTQILRKLNLIGYRNTFTSNIKVVEKYLEQFDPSVEFADLGNHWVMKIQPNSMSAIEVKKINIIIDSSDFSSDGNVNVSLFYNKEDVYEKIETKNVHYSINNQQCSIKMNIGELFDGINENMEKIKREYYFVFDLGATPIESSAVLESVVFSNLVTSVGRKLNNINILTEIPSNLLNNLNLEKKQKTILLNDNILAHTHLHPSKKQTLVIKNGTYYIDEDLIIPQGFSLIFNAGAHLILGPEVMIVGSRDLFINGTQSKPVIIESRSNDFPFGSLGFYGNGETTVSINNLLLSGGSEGWHKGIYFSGALSIHNHSLVKIINSSFHNNYADDGLNVKFANELLIEDCKFYNNYADQVDLDYCIGQVVKSVFSDSLQGDINGDGLDVSSSNLLIQSSTFYGFADKGISIGEDSRVFILENEILGNRHGIAIKDQSVLNIGSNNFKNNFLDIKIFQKKSIFGGATLRIPPSEKQKISIETDFRSRIIESIDENEWNLEYIKGLRNLQKHFIVNHNNLMYLQH